MALLACIIGPLPGQVHYCTIRQVRRFWSLGLPSLGEGVIMILSSFQSSLTPKGWPLGELEASELYVSTQTFVCETLVWLLRADRIDPAACQLIIDERINLTRLGGRSDERRWTILNRVGAKRASQRVEDLVALAVRSTDPGRTLRRYLRTLCRNTVSQVRRRAEYQRTVTLDGVNPVSDGHLDRIIAADFVEVMFRRLPQAEAAALSARYSDHTIRSERDTAACLGITRRTLRRQLIRAAARAAPL